MGSADENPPPAEAEGSASGVGAGMRPLPALKERVRELVDSWTELQSGSWNAMAAMSQYEEIERISGSAEQLNVKEIAEPAVELTVYLCTFVEGRIYPSNSQRQKLTELIERLRTAVVGGKVPGKARERSGVSDHRAVLYLRPKQSELPGLAAQLGRHRYVVRPCEDSTQAFALAEESPPDALLVDASMVAQLGDLLDHVERTRGEVKGRVVCVVVGDLADTSRRLFAQRAGADGVIEGADPVAIATRLDELLAQQRNLNYRVLIVEDDRGQALFCESVLQHRGIATQVCLTPDGVMDALVEFKPDLVLLDLYLPGMNGIEVAQLIRERPEYAFLPIVFLSGETDLDKRFDAIRMGGDDFITKPVKPRHLIVEVETRIRRGRLLPVRVDGSVRTERRGLLVSRNVFMEELVRATNLVEQSPACVVLIGLARDEELRDRLGLIKAGALSQQLAAVLAGETEMMRPVCAYGELMFLSIARAENDASLKRCLQNLQEKLAARRWLGSDDELIITPVIIGVRIAALADTGDKIIERARGLAREAQKVEVASMVYDAPKPTAAAVAEDPTHRLARTLLRGHLIPEAVRPEFQPLVPLKGELSGQYSVRFALIAPRATQRLEVPADRVRELAREFGVVVSADRQCVRRALSLLAERVQRGDEMRLFVPVAIESALDPSFAPWLAAELQRQALAPASVAIEISADEALREAARWPSAVESLQLVGARLCLSGLQGGEPHVRLVRTPGLSVVKLDAPPPTESGAADWGAERGRLVMEAGKHGKVVVATGVRDAREFASLLKLGAHYAQADIFAPWSTEANFDFAGAAV